MKKITAFFMALFPFLVVGLLFATNLISKNFSDKTVTAIEVKEEKPEIRKTEDGELVDEQLLTKNNNITVFPASATDPTVYWTSADESIATVEKETGKLTCKSYGDVRLDAVAKTNAQAKAHCTLKVWDNRIHEIKVKNEQQAKFLSRNSQLALDVVTIPNERIENPKLHFSIDQPGQGVTVSDTGLITVSPSATNGTYKITIETDSSPKVTKTIENIQVGDSSIDSIGFDNEATELIKTDTYNLYSHILTYPYAGKLDSDFYTYESLDPTSATVNDKGEVTFTNNYVPGTPVIFVVKFAGLSTISATKTLISSLNYHESVSFPKYSYTETFASFDNPQPITDTAFIPHAYPSGTTQDITLESSDTNVVQIINNQAYAVQPGKAIITAKAKSSETTFVSDQVEVTILKSTDQEIVSGNVTLDSTNYYPLRKSLNSIFEDRKVTWSGSATNAVVDNTNEIVYFTGTGSVDVTVKDDESGKTQKFTIECKNTSAKEIDVDTTTATITAGQKVIFKKNGAEIGLKTIPTELVHCTSVGEYVAIHGSTSVSLEFTDGTTFELIISEPLLSLKTKDGIDWTNYTTNATEFNFGEKIITYPATATYVDAWSGAYKPTIEYEATIEDESAAAFDEETNVLKFMKPATVAIKATSEGVSKTFRIHSTCGKYGKFSLVDDTTNKDIFFDDTITVVPGDEGTKTLTLKNFYCKDAVISQQTVEVFTQETKALSGDKVATVTPDFKDGNIIFKIKGIATGKDIIKISNGQFTFVLNVEVTKKITDVDVYCLGSTLQKGSEINVYDKSAILDIDIYPIAARDQSLTIKFNDQETTTGTRKIKLGDIPPASWKTTNTLEIISGTTSVASYTLLDKTTQDPDFTIKDIYGVEAGSNFSLRADEQYATMVIDLRGIAGQDYYSSFTSSIAGSQIYGKYIITPLAAPSREQYSQEITITHSSQSKKYNMVRDIVSRIELPKHNNYDETDAKGLQRVHVYGNMTQYADKSAPESTYLLPVNVYDYQGNIFEDKTDPSVKNKAIATLKKPTFNRAGGSASYDETSQCYKVTFDSNFLYTWQEMFNNEFVKATKNQTFSVYTEYGQNHKLDDSYVDYSFVVVKGVNVYDQKGIEVAQASQDKSIVLQTNFGLTEDPSKPMKDDKPFELTTFNFNEVYGNGYSINFHAATKAAGSADKTLSCKHGFNVNMVGCWYNQFTGLNHRAITFTNGGDCAENNPDTWAYCTFNSFHQPLTIWCSSGKQAYAHIKNCLFFNDQEYCRNAMSISDTGNTTTIENCAFFNAAKIAIMSNKGALVQLKGNIDVYNFHGSDMFDCMGWSATVKEIAWSATQKALEAGHVIQGLDYGSARPVANAYLFTTLGGEVKFYDHTEDGKDVYIYSEYGSEKAANYLKHAAGLWGLIEIWSTTRPPLPLQGIHSPAYTDEFINGEQLNYETRNLLIQRITRW